MAASDAPRRGVHPIGKSHFYALTLMLPSFPDLRSRSQRVSHKGFPSVPLLLEVRAGNREFAEKKKERKDAEKQRRDRKRKEKEAREKENQAREKEGNAPIPTPDSTPEP